MQRVILVVATLVVAACGGSDAGPMAQQGAGTGTGGALSASAGSAGLEAGGSAGSGMTSPSGAGGAQAGATSGTGGGVSSAGGGVVQGGAGGAASGASGANAGGGGMPNVDPVIRQVLMVGLSTGKPTPGDTLMINRLQGRSFKVTLVADTVVTAASADGKDLILISSSEESGNLGTKLRDLPIPTLCMEDGSFADMKMASARGHAMATTALDFMGTNALAGGQSGSVTIANAPPDPGEMGWGTVGPKAIVAATITAHPEQAALFGYEKGDDMLGLAAPARRAGFAAREDIASHFTEQGLKAFDVAVDWTLGHP